MEFLVAYNSDKEIIFTKNVTNIDEGTFDSIVDSIDNLYYFEVSIFSTLEDFEGCINEYDSSNTSAIFW